jgi:transposase
LKSPLAHEALDRIGRLYQIEDRIRGLSPEERLAQRQIYAIPVLDALHVWMIEKLSQVDRKSDLAEAFNYSLNRWKSLCRYTHDGRLSIDNNIAERSVRARSVDSAADQCTPRS